MNGPDREERALVLALRSAKAAVEEIETRLADLHAARASAETSLDWLAQAVRAEEEARRSAAADIHHFSSFLAGVDGKRAALTATRDQLSAEIDALASGFSAAEAELKKFERLLGISRRATALNEPKPDARDLHPAGAPRGRRGWAVR